MSAATAEDRSRNWLEMPAHLVPLFELECVPDPDTRRTPRPQPRPRSEVATGGTSAAAADETGSSRRAFRSNPSPKPAPRGATHSAADHNLGKPPLCTLPPAKPLPASDSLPPLKSEGWSFENRKPKRSADPSSAPDAEDDEPDFLREALKEIEDARAEKARLATAAQSAPPPAKKGTREKSASSAAPILLDMAHPMHAELQHARKSLRGAWISMIVLMLSVVGGVVYTTARLEKSDQHIERLLSELDAERTVSTMYKQQVAELFRELTDVKAEKSRAAARDHYASVAE